MRIQRYAGGLWQMCIQREDEAEKTMNRNLRQILRKGDDEHK